jgi:hypothetical protein
VDVEQLKRDLPIYVLDADYLTKMKDVPPDSKALDIEAMLASEPHLRAGAHLPARSLQQCRDAAVAIAAILAGKLDDRCGESILVLTSYR